MKNTIKFLSSVLILCLLLGSFAACNKPQNPADTTEGSESESSTKAPETPEFVDYVSQLKLDLSTDTKKQEATVKTFVDGDTTHFNVPSGVIEGGVLKARYIAINTPESTGKIEEYGKTASKFTKEKLSSATSIILESDTSTWDADSTGSRYLVWVWYKTSDDSEYRNLNLEILQSGLALASSTANNRYGEICMKALNQAKILKYKLYSGEKDPDFYYGDAQELTLKELRLNVEKYNGSKVAFEGVITLNNNNGVYLEEYDEETDMYYGMYVYYGFGLNGAGLEILSVGNRARIVGSVSLYEAGGTYQVSGVEYKQMRPNDPGNIQKISDGHKPAFVPTSAEKFKNGKVSVSVGEDEVKEFPYAELALGTTLSMEELTVKRVYTTSNSDSSSYGAMTLTCEIGGVEVDVRTIPLYENGKLVTSDRYVGQKIDVKGIVEYYKPEGQTTGSYQIKVLTLDQITIK